MIDTQNEFYAEFSQDFIGDDGSLYVVDVETVGGGTVGKSYAGNDWLVRITKSDGTLVLTTDKLHIPAKVNHLQAASQAMDFFNAEVGDDRVG